jgi:hypothetical protein
MALKRGSNPLISVLWAYDLKPSTTIDFMCMAAESNFVFKSSINKMVTFQTGAQNICLSRMSKRKYRKTKSLNFIQKMYFRACHQIRGQKSFRTTIFPCGFHIKPLIFKTFSWSHFLSNIQFYWIFQFKIKIDMRLLFSDIFSNFYNLIGEKKNRVFKSYS